MKKTSVFLRKILCMMTVLSFHSVLVADGTSVKTLCPQGYYLSRCGADVVLGTNWLKGLSITESNSTTVVGYNYYSYDKPASDIIHMTNLRKFFAAKEPLTYYAGGEATEVPVGTYTSYRNTMLVKFCTDAEGKPTNIECEKCPGNATVTASTVEIDTDGKIKDGTWNIHTIADCYMDEFSDETGTYVYIPNNVNVDASANAANCYYSTNVAGTNMRQEQM